MDTESITGAPRADIITGKLLSPFRHEMFGTASGYFRRQAIEEYAMIAAGLREKDKHGEAAAVLEIIDTKTRNGDFNWSRPGFVSAAFDVANLPFLLWLSLRVTEPKISLAEATALITIENTAKVQTGILQLMRYVSEAKPNTSKKADAPPVESGANTTDLTAGKSSPDSSS